MSISRDEILMGRDTEFPLSPELETNLAVLLEAVNKLRDLYGKPMYVSSGYRPGHWNRDAGGATNSPHVTCQAVDFVDHDHAIKDWLTVDILIECGLWQEDPKHTVGWVHCQVRPIPSGHRVFIP